MNWISVKDKLPEKDLLVLVTDKTTYPCTSVGEYNGRYWAVLSTLGTYDNTMHNRKITHWMPLPEPQEDL